MKIYEVKHAGTKKGVVFTVVWHAGGRRTTRQFTDEKKALEEATLKADQLAAGRIGAASVSVDDAELLFEARKIAGSIPVMAALAEWSKVREIAGGDLLAAAKAWKDVHGTGMKKLTVADAVDKFLAFKKRSKVDVQASYMKTLPRLKEQLGGRAIGSISSRALEQWIHEAFKVGPEKHAHPATFNTVRKRVVTLWRWCRKEGYLPRNAQTEAERLEFVQEEATAIGILEVKAFAQVLETMRESHPAHLAVAVLAGFCGLRRSELHGQKWKDVYLDRGFLKVTKAKRNTPGMRLVQLAPAAVDWLMLCDRSGDKVSPPWGLDRVRAFSRGAGIDCPENGFRHSFISYRVAMTGNVAETSLEAGNSSDIVFKHYRELVEKGEGSQWFELGPKQTKALIKGAGKVVRLA